MPWVIILNIGEKGITIKNLILASGGMFLLWKATKEIYNLVENEEENKVEFTTTKESMMFVIFQIIIFDLIFSLDSVLTAVGMTDNFSVMVIAVILSVCIMILFAKSISNFINKNPSIKVLALSFLILIGVLLVAEGFDNHINKAYIYFAMLFSLLVEFLNKRKLRKRK